MDDEICDTDSETNIQYVRAGGQTENVRNPEVLNERPMDQAPESQMQTSHPITIYNVQNAQYCQFGDRNSMNPSTSKSDDDIDLSDKLLRCSFSMSSPESVPDYSPLSTGSFSPRNYHMSALLGQSWSYPRLFHGQSSRPQKLDNIPFSPCEVYTPQGNVFDRMRKNLHDMKMNLAILSGCTGSGKTTTAIQFAHEHRHLYTNGLFWISCKDSTTVKNSLSKIGSNLSLFATLPNFDIESVQRGFVEYLQSTDKWLLILDGLDDNAMLLKLGRESEFIPRWQDMKGHILITSKCTNSFQSFHLKADKYVVMMPDEFTRDEAKLFLSKRCYEPEKSEEAIVDQILGNLASCLPLQLEQVGSFISAKQYTYNEYLDRLDHDNSDLPVDNPSYGYKIILKESLDDNLHEVTLEILGLLNVCAFAHHNTILLKLFVGIEKMPKWIKSRFSKESQIIHLIEHVEQQKPMKDILSCASDFGLIKWMRCNCGRDDHKDKFCIHPSVQHHILTKLETNQEETIACLQALACLLIHLFASRKHHEDLILLNNLLPHAHTCLKHFSKHGLEKTYHYLRLKIRTAFVYLALYSFKFALQLLDECHRTVLELQNCTGSKISIFFGFKTAPDYCIDSFGKQNPQTVLRKLEEKIYRGKGVINRHQGDWSSSVANLAQAYQRIDLACCVDKFDVALKIAHTYLDSHDYDQAYRYLKIAEEDLQRGLMASPAVQCSEIDHGHFCAVYGKYYLHLAHAERESGSYRHSNNLIQARMKYQEACKRIPRDCFRHVIYAIILEEIEVKLDSTREKAEEAYAAVVKQVELLKQCLNQNEHHPHYAWAQVKLAWLCLNINNEEKLKEGLCIINDAVVKLEKVYGRAHRHIGNAYFVKGDLLVQVCEYENAMEMYMKCKEHYSEKNLKYRHLESAISEVEKLIKTNAT